MTGVQYDPTVGVWFAFKRDCNGRLVAIRECPSEALAVNTARILADEDKAAE